jgi:SEC-C motif domain protein
MPYHTGSAIPPSAEALMRSRYTAYVLANTAYLKATWHPECLPTSFALDEQERVQWLGLQVKRHEASDDNHAVVEFVARYKINGRAHRLHEVSRFVREQGRWWYQDGAVENPR